MTGNNCEFVFANRAEMDGIAEYEEIEKNGIELMSSFFLQMKGEVIYVERNSIIYGIVTPSDFFLCLSESSTEPAKCINTRFRYLKAFDSREAMSFFKNFPKCHEVPIVKAGRLEGVIKDGCSKPEEEWIDIGKKINDGIHTIKKMEYYCGLIKEVDGEWLKTHFALIQNLKDLSVCDALSIEEKEVLRNRSGKTSKQVYYDDFDNRWYGDSFFEDYDQIKFRYEKGVFRFEDLITKSINIIGGHRVTLRANPNAPRRILMFGPCNVFGAYVRDEDTIENYLQGILSNNNYAEFQVVNCGTIGPEQCLDVLFSTAIYENDVVICFVPGMDDVFKKNLGEFYYTGLSEVYSNIDRPTNHFLDNVRHCDGLVNKNVAERLWTIIEGFLENEQHSSEINNKVMGDNNYIPPDVRIYFDDFLAYNHLKAESKLTIGTIVMNCNPFTNGHKHLIEHASKEVDRLIIFVVQEDKSFFSFNDRYNMVVAGVADYRNIIVVPSGKYIISKDTFAQYFEKEEVYSIVEDMEYDIRIFGEIVCKRLAISVRFVGEEPFDEVTRKYNERMKEILPEYGVRLEVIPRATSKGKEISATNVRRLLSDKDWESICRLCPDSTVTYLKGVYDQYYT